MEPTRRSFLALSGALAAPDRKARIAITFDLEMSRNFPRWDDVHWDYEKGNLDDAAKRYSVAAARRVKENGGRLHFFAVGRVFEQEDAGWLEEIVRAGHPVGNHTYDHVYLLARKPEQIQFRFARAPWLVEGQTVAQVIEHNIRMTTAAMKQRLGVAPAGFRAPGGFSDGVAGRPDLQRMLLSLGFTWASTRYGLRLTGEPGSPPPQETLADIRQEVRRSQPFRYPETGLLEIPMSPVSDIGAFRGARWNLETFLNVTRMCVEEAIQSRGVFDFLGHPSCIGVVDPELRTVDLICKLVRDAGSRAELTTLDAVARGMGA